MRSPIPGILAPLFAGYIPGATIPPGVDPIPTISAAPSPTMTALAILLTLTMLIAFAIFFFVMENAKATKALTHELSVTNKALAQAMDPAYENSPAQSLNNVQVLLKNSAFFQSSTQSSIMRKYTSEANRLAGTRRTAKELPLLRGEIASASDSLSPRNPLYPLNPVDPEAQHEHNQDAFIQSLLEQQEHFRKELDRLKSQHAHPSNPANRTNTHASQHPGLKRKLSVPPPAVRESDNSIGDPFEEGAYTRPASELLREVREENGHTLHEVDPDDPDMDALVAEDQRSYEETYSSLDHPQGSDGAMMRDRQEQQLTEEEYRRASLTTWPASEATLQAGVENGGPGDTDTYPSETYAEENARMRDQADATAKQIRDEAEKDAE